MMTQPTDITKNRLQQWMMSTCHSDEGTWVVKAFTLSHKHGVPPQFTDLRSFVVKGEETKVHDVVDQIIGEAEATCEGLGGGTSQFVIKAYMDGQRSPVSTRPFTVTLEQTEAADAAEATAQGVLGVILRQNQQLHASVIQMSSALSSGLPRILEAQAELITTMQRRDIDSFQLMRANIEDKERRQAEAMAIAQKSQDWSELKQILIPAVLEHLGPVIAKVMERMATPPVETAQVSSSGAGGDGRNDAALMPNDVPLLTGSN